MSLTLHALVNHAAWTELLRLFGNPSSAAAEGGTVAVATRDERGKDLLVRLGFPEDRIPRRTIDANAFWTQICTEVEAGKVAGADLERLLELAADFYPGNPAFSAWRVHGSKPGERTGASIQVESPATPEIVLRLARQLARDLGIKGSLEAVPRSGKRISINLMQPMSAEAPQLAEALSNTLRSQGVPVRIQCHPFRDYLITQIFTEGPHGQRYTLEDVPGSTQVSDIGQAVVSQYTPEMMPRDPEGQPRPVTVDKIEGGKAERLDPSQTVHEAGLSDGGPILVGSQAIPKDLWSTQSGRSAWLAERALRGLEGLLGAKFAACGFAAEVWRVFSSLSDVQRLLQLAGIEQAPLFARGFYTGIVNHRSIGASFRLGVAQVRIESLPDSDDFKLHARDGVDVEQLVLYPP